MLYATGYGNSKKIEFISILRKHDVKVLFDIRYNPVSSWQYWTNSRFLAKSLEKVNVVYKHVPELGGGKLYPKTLQIKYLKAVIAVSKKLNSVMMCSEKYAEDCHRKKIIEPLLEELNESFDKHILIGTDNRRKNKKEQISKVQYNLI